MRDVIDEINTPDYETSLFNARILIIDDDIGFIKILGSMLSEYPNQYFADSGLEGLRLAREVVPDLILLDFEMPVLGGADLGMILKSDPALAAVPVIFITSHREVSVVTATFQAGGKEFITKPVSRSILLDRVHEQLQRTRDS